MALKGVRTLFTVPTLIRKGFRDLVGRTINHRMRVRTAREKKGGIRKRIGKGTDEECGATSTETE